MTKGGGEVAMVKATAGRGSGFGAQRWWMWWRRLLLTLDSDLLTRSFVKCNGLGEAKEENENI